MNYDEQEMVAGRQNVIAASPKDKFFFKPCTLYIYFKFFLQPFKPCHLGSFLVLSLNVSSLQNKNIKFQVKKINGSKQGEH